MAAAGSIEAAQAVVERGDEVRVTVTIHDAYGSALPGVFCTLSIVSQPGEDASLAPSFETTDADGQVATTLHAGEAVGTIELEARCGEIAMRAEVRVVAPPPASLPDTGTGDWHAGASRAAVLALPGLVFLAGLFCLAAYRARRHHAARAHD